MNLKEFVITLETCYRVMSRQKIFENISDFQKKFRFLKKIRLSEKNRFLKILQIFGKISVFWKITKFSKKNSGKAQTKLGKSGQANRLG